MGTGSAAQTARAKRLLVAEGASGGTAEAYAAAAGRLYDKLEAELSPLLGAAGFQALFVRSAKLGQREVAYLTEVVESPMKLRSCLQALNPVAAADTAEALFGTFFTLLTTFIGERLTTQALRRQWPMIEESVPTEKKK